jgi:hypothetical protein
MGFGFRVWVARCMVQGVGFRAQGSGFGERPCVLSESRWLAIETVELPVCTEISALNVLFRGTSPIRKRQPPWDPPRTLGIGLQ